HARKRGTHARRKACGALGTPDKPWQGHRLRAARASSPSAWADMTTSVPPPDPTQPLTASLPLGHAARPPSHALKAAQDNLAPCRIAHARKRKATHPRRAGGLVRDGSALLSTGKTMVFYGAHEKVGLFPQSLPAIRWVREFHMTYHPVAYRQAQPVNHAKRTVSLPLYPL
ncbi:MAG: hypothetical protein EA399_00600, partial [Desulfovibrionales bacterium]